MKAMFETRIRADLEGDPMQIYCRLQGAPAQELAVTLDAEDGWVDAKQLVRALRVIANKTEKEMA